MAEPLYMDQTLLTIVNDETEAERLNTAPHFFLDMFFPVGVRKAVPTEIIRVEEWVSNSGAASFRYAREDAKVIRRKGRAVRGYTAPHIKEKMPWEVADLMSAGADSFGTTPDAMIDRLLMDDLTTLKTRTQNRMEIMALGALTGGWTYDEDGMEIEVDFHYPAEALPVNAGADIWGTGTETIVADIDADIATARQLSRGNVTKIIFGVTAWGRAYADEEFRAAYDTNNFGVGRLDINPNEVYQGKYKAIDIYVVSEGYTTTADDGTETWVEIFDPNSYMVVTTALQTFLPFGQVKYLDPANPRKLITATIPYYTTQYASGNPEAQTLWNLIWSRPFPLVGSNNGIVYRVTA